MGTDCDFKEIYDEYYPKIRQYLSRIVGPDDAEDMTQVVFSKINSALKDFQGKSRLSTWIYRIATNAAIDRSRCAAYKQAAEEISIEDEAGRHPPCVPQDRAGSATDQLVIRKEMRECINEYIEKLPADYRTVLVLSEMEGLPNKEIAEILGITLDNAKIRLHRARARLKEVLNAACDFYYTDENTLACDRKQVHIMPKVPK